MGVLNNLCGNENQNHNKRPGSTINFIFVEVRSELNLAGMLENKLFNENEVVAQRYAVQESDTTMMP